VIEDILADLKNVSKPFSTGLRKLDEAMGAGMFPGKSYGFAARKKVGKTILAGTISCNLSMNRVKHLFICGEMSPKEIHQRTLSRLTDSFPSAFRSEYGQSGEFMAKVAEAARLSTRSTLYHNAPGISFQELRRVLATAVYRHGIKGFILDYWQLVGGKRNGQSTAEHLDEVAQWIADFCRKHGIWSVTMAQLNQGGNTRGGEGVRLAFDQVYALRGMIPPDAKTDDEVEEDLAYPYRWVEMLDTRYTAWNNIGTKATPGLRLEEKGPYFTQHGGGQ
jgi:replicative DNA helicase